MLRRHGQLLIISLMVTDLVVCAAAFLASYYLRFHTVLEVPKGIPPLLEYLRALPAVLAICFISLRYHNLYLPKRLDRLWDELGVLIRTTITMVILLVALAFFYRDFSFSQGLVLIFAVVNSSLLFLSRVFARLVLRHFRARGFNRRYAVIVGGGRIGKQLLTELRRAEWTGIEVLGFIELDTRLVGRHVLGLPVLGHIGELSRVLAERRVDQVFIALPYHQFGRVQQVTEDLLREVVDVRIVADILALHGLNKSITDFEGIPLINLRESPYGGWNLLVKRLIDFSVALVLLIALLPLLAIIALAVRLGSRGPVFYKQKRVGLDGRRFSIYKFRTMVADAEHQTGAVWATSEDARRTRLGALLRRTALDELPQLFNVLRGDMSLVGPRPERPVFVERFREDYRGYMLRHKVKAGITGWAQVMGYRGNTSLKKRVEYDLYYVENWSIWFDLKILLMTPWALIRPRFPSAVT